VHVVINKIDKYIECINFINTMARDYCSPLRKSYTGVLKALAATNVVAGLFTGVPFYYLFAIAGYYTNLPTYYYYSYYTQPIWIFGSILMVGWIIGMVALWKTMPNLLTIAIFLYKAIGYWCLVSFFLVLFYFTPYLHGMGTLGMVMIVILPSILFLLFCADILRTARTRLYTALDPRPALPAVDARPVIQV
jgi:hypothetical protein